MPPLTIDRIDLLICRDGARAELHHERSPPHHAPPHHRQGVRRRARRVGRIGVAGGSVLLRGDDGNGLAHPRRLPRAVGAGQAVHERGGAARLLRAASSATTSPRRVSRWRRGTCWPKRRACRCTPARRDAARGALRRQPRHRAEHRRSVPQHRPVPRRGLSPHQAEDRARDATSTTCGRCASAIPTCR